MRRNAGLLATIVMIGIVFWLAQACLSGGDLRNPVATLASPGAPNETSTAPATVSQPATTPMNSGPTAGETTAAPRAAVTPAAAQTAREPVPVVEAAETVRPAVVAIAVRQVTPGLFLQPVPQSGVGSGVIFNDTGHIITNNHVVEDARDLRVTLPDGRTFPGKIVGADRPTDLAIIKIEGQDLPRARLGDSDKLRIGEWVVAIGNALGLEGGPTVTAGVVGALNRTLTEPNGETLENLIQTDAAINPGNSGGPLINLAGEVVGINTAIATEAQGIGFAISISAARRIIDELMAFGRVVRPFIGIRTENVTPTLASRFDLPVREGLLVVAVDRGTPAARSGIQQGDVITAFDGEKLRHARDLRAQLDKHKPGDAVRLTVLRNGRQLTVSVTLAESPR